MRFALLSWSDDVLRRANWTNSPVPGSWSLAKLLACLLGCGFFYGATMGCFGGLAGAEQWPRQMLYSAVKVPLLLLVTFAISLPSFFVFNTLVGLRSDFSVALRSLFATQVGFTIVLASLAPLTLFWYASSPHYRQALLFNGVMFAAASLSSQWLLRGYYAPLVARNPRHRKLLWAWTGIYALVAIQLAWLLRPFIGSPGRPVTFVREEAWDNAYVMVLQLVWNTLFR